MILRNILAAGLLVLSTTLACGQTNIVDIQEVNPQGSSDQSPFLGSRVTVRGIVTASAESDNLGIIYLQQSGVQAWAGIRINTGNSNLLSLVVGNRVVVTGRVSESSGRTGLDEVVIDSIQGTGAIDPVELDPAVFTNYSLAENERYESMLVRLRVDGQLINVVDVNADGPSNNFGEWRVGTDPGMPDVGCRILTGRSTSTAFSSLNVSYVNDSIWAFNSGVMQVDPIQVTTDTAFQAITGVVEYSFGNMKLLPRNNDDFVLRGGAVATEELPAVITRSRLFPNPVESFSTIELNLKKPSFFAVDLYNAAGDLVRQLVVAQPYPAGVNTLSLPNLGDTPKGAYFLRVYGPEGMVVLPMVKQ